jgi:hypothetical protein
MAILLVEGQTMNKRLFLGLIILAQATAFAAGAADPSIPSALPATQPAANLPWSRR